MAQLTLTKIRIQEGVWHGELVVEGAENMQPQIEVWHLGQLLQDVVLKEYPGQNGTFGLSVPIPAALLADGVQTFVISNADNGDRLAAFSIVTGHPMQDDIRAEVSLLREELDMLKRAFRRHCVETM